MNEDKFTGKAAIYAKYRPSYPTAVVDRLYELSLIHISEPTRH